MVNQKLITSNKPLIVTLGVLCLAIIALVVGLAIPKNQPAVPEPVEKTALYYKNLAYDTMNDDTEKKYSEQVIGALIQSDNMEPTIDSAINIINAASYYGLSDIYEEYNQILRERQINAGIDPDMKGEG